MCDKQLTNTQQTDTMLNEQDINFFIENEASAVAVNHNGSTPLHIAAR